MTSRAAGLGLLLTAAVGCGTVPLGPLAAEAPLVASRTAPPLPLRVAVAPVRRLATPPGEHAGALDWPLADAQAAVGAALEAAGTAVRVRALAAGAETREAALAAAWAGGDDLLVECEVSRCEAAYLGTNGWYLPNLLLWIELVVPAWFVPDEEYVVRIEGTVRVLAVATGTVVCETPVSGTVQEALDDFQRGIVLLGTLRVPSALGESNWRAIGARLHARAVREYQIAVGTRVAEGLREAARTGTLAAATRQTLALLVGCGTYYHHHLANVKFPVPDIEALRAWLVGSGVPDRQVRCLRDEAATRDRILREIREFLVARARPGDRVVVAFAGYAAPDGTGSIALLPHDADPERPGATGLPLVTLTGALRAIRGATLLCCLDAGMGEAPAERFVPCGLPAPERARVGADLAALAARPDTTVLVAGEPGEGAAEAGAQRHGLLTLGLLLALQSARDRDGDGRLTMREAFRDVRRGVQLYALLTGRTQTPQCLGAAESFDLPRAPLPAGGGAA